jgi:hypothetical protein
MSMTKEIVLAGLWMLGTTGSFAADAPATTDWKAKLPAVQAVVRHQFLKEVAQAHYAPSITRTADVIGTGVPVALVNLGTGGYTDALTVMRLEGDMPVAARFRGKDKKVSSMVFLAGLSEGKGEAVEFMPNDHAIFSGHWTVNGTKLKGCRGEAYVWDATEKDFGFEKKLSKSMTREFCQKVAAAQLPHSPGEDKH